MIHLVDFDPWWRFGVALLIGALLGLEREFFQQKEDIPNFAGIRTFSLISLLGAVTAFLYPIYGLIPIAISLSGLIILSAIGHQGSISRGSEIKGITTEVAAMLTFLFGTLVMGDHINIAVPLSVVTAILLAAKGKLHGVIRRMSAEDMYMTLQFALVTAVILPILPNKPIDPWELLNPFQIWLMVVLVLGIGFSGYILIKLFGATKGINLMGILGGLASSTATTISFSSSSRENPELSPNYARAVVLASTVMFPRIILLILITYPALTFWIAPPMTGMLLAGFGIVLFLQKNSYTDESNFKQVVLLQHPLRLSTALKFGVIFAIVIVILEFALTSFGVTGVYFTSLIAGLTDVNIITLSVSRLAKNSQLSIQIAGIAIVIAAIMNTISKGMIAYFTGSKELFKIIVKAFSIILFVGILTSLLMIWLF
jgi:uncharacterized membrane protein (DUF4010 family)